MTWAPPPLMTLLRAPPFARSITAFNDKIRATVILKSRQTKPNNNIASFRLGASSIFTNAYQASTILA